MKKIFEIRYLRTAEQDVYDIFDYIKDDRPIAAKLLLQKIDETINNLKTNPQLGLVPSDQQLKAKGYRMLIIDNYIVFYIIKKNIIQIRRIIHGAQDYRFLFA